MIEILSGTWAAGETKNFVIAGKYLEVLDAQYPCDIFLLDRSGGQMSVMRNSEASFFSRPSEGFEHIQIYSAQAQVIRFFVGSGDAGTRRISSTVQVIDGGYNRSAGGASFMAAMFGASAAGENPNAQLWNPVGSGRNIVVKQVVMGDATSSASLDFLVGTPLQVNNMGLSQVVNKRMGGPASVAQAVMRSSPSLLAGTNALTIGVQQNAPFQYAFQEPLVVVPGTGIIVRTASAAHFLFATFDFFEQVI